MLAALAVIVAALCFATTSPAYVLADTDGSAMSVGAARLLLGGAILGAIAWRQYLRTPPPPRPPGRGLDRIPSWVFVVAGALGMFAFQPTYFGGAAMNGVAIGTVVAIGSAPIITGVLDAIIRRRIPSLRWGVATAVALVGVVLVSGVIGQGGVDAGGTGATVNPLGILTSVGAGASYAVYAIATKILLDRGWRVGLAAGSVFGVTAILSLPVVIATPTDWLLTTEGALLVIWLALVATVLAYLLLGWGLERLNPTTVTTLTLAEPLGATLLGVIVLREQLSPVSIAGLVVIAIGLTILSVPARERRIQVSAAVITDADGRLLVVRKHGTTAFMQPGGKPEPGESPSETLRRELGEELGLDVDPRALRALGTFTAPAANEPGFEVVAEVFAVDIGDQRPVAAAEIAELRWISRADAEQIEVAPLAARNFLPPEPPGRHAATEEAAPR